MKLKRVGSWALFLALFSTTMVACEKDEDNTNNPGTITDVVVNGASFTLLEKAVVRAELATTLATTQNLTVFAPTDEAFINAGLTEAVINSKSKEELQEVLKYHVLTSKIPASSVPAGPNAAVATFGGKNIYVTKSGANVFVNGVQVVTADVAASNGVIHVVNRVIVPPAGNIVQTAQAVPTLSYLVAAVLRADASGTSISGALSGAGPLTVFAPTNDAFIAAGYPTIASINAEDPNKLKNILLYHVIGARVYSSDLTEGAQPVTLQGGKVTITLSGGAKVKGATNTSATVIASTDITTTNGVVHVINGVLLP
ncbi:MAG: fasciclin domain-containing protein [Chitinophagaceae bacterium]|uniref:fasciclin domain-containing protein n=1 Tax=unclassified Paraflavitalea TaxID=2798305 RepID=UPI003D32C6D7|nr:fasciclin domain-containing protein [Chitinophagaceae bacterium]